MTVSDTTFRFYSDAEAQKYSVLRGAYKSSLYEKVFQHFAETGGQFGTMLDVGCGPGTATKDVAQFFNRVIGVDPGQAMIDQARAAGYKTKSGEDVEFVVAGAEDIANVSSIQPESVDMMISATAAHWFDMNKFWAAAAKVLKPGGMVAIWSISGVYCHPSTPNAPVVAEILDGIQRNVMLRYESAENLLPRGGYRKLLMPWNVTPPVPAFDKNTFWHHVYDENGVLDDGVAFFGKENEHKLENFARGLQTTSGFKNWAAQHPDHSGPDPITKSVMSIRDVTNSDLLRCGMSTALIMFRKIR